MDREKLRKVLSEITRINPRGGEVLPKNDGVFERVNLYFCTVDVYLVMAQRHKHELEAFLRVRRKKFFSGLDYVSFGRVIGDQALSFPFLAVGKTLGFWDLIIPKNPGELLSLTDFQL